MRMIKEHTPTELDEMKSYNEGVESVLFIRCMQHFKVPQYNENETGGAECAACRVEATEATLSTAVNIIGGQVEGAPTTRVNFLQRLRELVDNEAAFHRLERAYVKGSWDEAPSGPALCDTCRQPLSSHGAECAVTCCFCGKTLAEHFDEKDYPYHGNLPRVPCLMLKTNFNLRTDGA